MIQSHSNNFYIRNAILGYAEMAIMRPPDCGYETPMSEQSLSFEGVSFQLFSCVIKKFQICYKITDIEEITFRLT